MNKKQAYQKKVRLFMKLVIKTEVTELYFLMNLMVSLSLILTK